MFGSIGWGEILVVLVIVLVLFGAKRLPELAKSIGSSLHSFKKGMSEGFDTEDKKESKETKTV